MGATKASAGAVYAPNGRDRWVWHRKKTTRAEVCRRDREARAWRAREWRTVVLGDSAARSEWN